MNLTPLFNPKSVAVIGASSDKNKVGYALMANLVAESGVLGSPASRKIFPISISEAEIMGLKTSRSINDIPGDNPIDLAVIAVRADIVPSILEECATKGIKSVIIISAGFKEMGPTGAELEKKILGIAKKNDITLLGPNCLGIIDTHTNLNASFAAGTPKKGHIAFLSQSGALGTAILDKATTEGVGFSKFVSLGNEATLSEIEFLEYFKNDEATKAILMYVEQLSNGREFMRLATEITKTKPIVLIKAGRGAKGQRAVMSHTGSLAPEDKVFDAACRQSGIIVVESIREFYNMAKLFELGIFKPLQKLIILTNAGGPAVVASDLVDFSKSLSLIEIKDEMKESLRKVLPPMAGLNNPIDIIGDALATRYEAALQILSLEKEADAILVLLTPQMMTEVGATAELLVKYNTKKPIIPIFIGGGSIEKGLVVLNDHNLVNFNFPKDAIEALDNLAREIGRKTERPRSDLVKPRTKSLMVKFPEMKRLLSDHDLSLSGILVEKKAGLTEAISKLGNGPFAMKVISTDIVHKTDSGAVSLSIKDLGEANVAWDAMKENILRQNPNAEIEGMLVQKMSSGKEIIVGMKRDPIFGPTILFGLGGILAEAIKDTSLRIAPVSKEMAFEMIQEIKGFNILNGLRGEKPIDFEMLVNIIVNLSNLAMKHPEIQEVDLNPVMARPDGVEIVDARVMV